EGLSTMRARPACRRIGWRQELRRHLARSAKGGIVEHSEVLIDSPAGHLGRKALRSFDALLPVRIGLDQAGIDSKTFAADQALVHAPTQDGLEQLAYEITIAEAAMAVLREGGVIRNVCFQAQP